MGEFTAMNDFRFLKLTDTVENSVISFKEVIETFSAVSVTEGEFTVAVDMVSHHILQYCLQENDYQLVFRALNIKIGNSPHRT